jgi:hypothetical protein
MFASTSHVVKARDVSRTLSITPNSKQNITSETGKVVIPPQFNDAYSFAEGVAAVQMGGKWGYIRR